MIDESKLKFQGAPKLEAQSYYLEECLLSTSKVSVTTNEYQ